MAEGKRLRRVSRKKSLKIGQVFIKTESKSTKVRGQPATGEFCEGIFLPLSLGQNFPYHHEYRSLGNGNPESKAVEPKTYMRDIREENPLKIKYQGTEPEAWDHLEDCHEWSINSQLLLREEYLSRLRAACLPLAAQLESERSSPEVPDEAEIADTAAIIHLASLLRKITVDVVVNICQSDLPRPFLWKGRNILLQIPSELNFASCFPQIAAILNLKTLRRNPFLDEEPLPEPHSEKGQIILQNNSAKGHISLARQAILREEEQHGIQTVHGSFFEWKELQTQQAQELKKKEKNQKIAKELLPKLARVSISPHNVHCFRRQDADGDGMLTYKEFLRGFYLLLLPFKLESEHEKEWLLEQVDPQRAGWVAYNAFNKLCEAAKKKKSYKNFRKQEQSTSMSPSTTHLRSGVEAATSLQRCSSPSTRSTFQADSKESFAAEIDDVAYILETRQSAIHSQLRRLTERREKLQNEYDEVTRELTICNPVGKNNIGPHAHVEYARANERKKQEIVGELTTFRQELKDAIGQLNCRESSLVTEQLEVKTKLLWHLEIRQSEKEESVMKDYEASIRHQLKAQAKAIAEQERARRKEEEKKYKVEQRLVRKRALREKLRREHSAATVIANSFRSWQSRIRLAWLQQSAFEAYEAIHTSRMFDTSERRLLERPTPILLLATGNRGDRILKFLRRAMPGNFWGVLPMLDCRSTINLAGTIEEYLNKHASLFWKLDHDLNEDLSAAILLSLESVHPRPLILYTGDSGRSVNAGTKWLSDGALKYVDANYYSEMLYNQDLGVMRMLEEAIKLLLPTSNADANKNSDPNLFERLVQFCRSNTPWRPTAQQLRAATEITNQSTWLKTPFWESPGLAVLRAYVEIKVGRPSQNFTRELVDLDLSDKTVQRCEDIIVHFSLRELRIFQTQAKKGAFTSNDLGTTLFRYGPRHVVVRTIPRGDDAVYRLYDARDLANRLALSSGGDFRTQIDRIRAGKRIRTSAQIPGNQMLDTNKNHKINDGSLVVARIHPATRLIEDTEHNLIICRGSKTGYVCWLHRSNKAARVQVKMISCEPPFAELRGTIPFDSNLQGQELQRYLMDALRRLRPNPLTGLVNLAQ